MSLSVVIRARHGAQAENSGVLPRTAKTSTVEDGKLNKLSSQGRVQPQRISRRGFFKVSE